jgi:hypothetical protein
MSVEAPILSRADKTEQSTSFDGRGERYVPRVESLLVNRLLRRYIVGVERPPVYPAAPLFYLRH